MGQSRFDPALPHFNSYFFSSKQWLFASNVSILNVSPLSRVANIR